MAESSVVGPVGEDNYTNAVKAQLQEREGEVAPNYDGFYFFLSLDLVNSTAYKGGNADWQARIREFYDAAENYWRDHQAEERDGLTFLPRVWKYAGDEVLFYRRVRSLDELERFVHASYKGMRFVSELMQKATKGNSPRLFVKGTCWAAKAEYRHPGKLEDLGALKGVNLVFPSVLQTGEGQTVLEFLGPQIDTGFRTSGASAKNALVVSAEIAGAFAKQGSAVARDAVRVVDYRELKGVWRGRYYPIVWYREDWTTLDADYEYDDVFRSEIVQRAKDATEASVKKLPAILDSLDETWLLELPKHLTDSDKRSLSRDDEPVPSLEVHSVAICFAPDGSVLLALRESSKSSNPKKWEAGCARLRGNEGFAAALQRHYKRDFGLDLTILGDGEAQPVGTYEFVKRGGLVPGIIFAATVADETKAEAKKHPKIAWFAADKLPPESECVPNLHRHIGNARNLWLKLGLDKGETRS